MCCWRRYSSSNGHCALCAQVDGVLNNPGPYAEWVQEYLAKATAVRKRGDYSPPGGGPRDSYKLPSLHAIMACNVLISQKNGWPMKALGSPWAAPALESLFNKAKHRIEKEVTQDFLPKETNGFGLPAKSMAVYKLAEEEETYVITFRATGCLSDWATDVAMIQQVGHTLQTPPWPDLSAETSLPHTHTIP